MATQWEYSTLWNNEDQMTYNIFRRDGRYQQVSSYSLDLWSECLAILGEIGWEGFHIQETSNPDTTTWWFKRAISPNNDNLKIN